MFRYAISATFMFSIVLIVRQVPATSFMLSKGERIFAVFIPKVITQCPKGTLNMLKCVGNYFALAQHFHVQNTVTISTFWSVM